MLRSITFVAVMAVSANTQAFSSNFTLFSDASIAGTDAGADGLWGTGDDAANAANPLGGVSYVYTSTNGPFGSVTSYEGFGIGNFILETPGVSSSADYSALNIFGTIPTPAGSILPFQVGSLLLDNSVTSSINYTDPNNMMFTGDLTVQTPMGSSYSLTGAGYTIYNADGFDDPSIFGSLLGSTNFDQSLANHFNYLIGIAPESWTAITVNFLDLEDSDLSVLLSSYSVDENLLPATNEVPLPPAAWLLGSALFGLIYSPRKKISC